MSKGGHACGEKGFHVFYKERRCIQREEKYWEKRRNGLRVLSVGVSRSLLMNYFDFLSSLSYTKRNWFHSLSFPVFSFMLASHTKRQQLGTFILPYPHSFALPPSLHLPPSLIAVLHFLATALSSTPTSFSISLTIHNACTSPQTYTLLFLPSHHQTQHAHPPLAASAPPRPPTATFPPPPPALPAPLCMNRIPTLSSAGSITPVSIFSYTASATRVKA